MNNTQILAEISVMQATAQTLLKTADRLRNMVAGTGNPPTTRKGKQKDQAAIQALTKRSIRKSKKITSNGTIKL